MKYIDPCMHYLQEAERIADGYIEISATKAFFESDDPEVAETLNSNAEVQQKSTSALKKACQAVRNLINRLIEGIQNFIDKFKMTKDEKNNYKAFLQKAAQDPGLKGKKITVKDWRVINAAYDKAIKETEQQIQAIDKAKDDIADEKINAFIDSVKKQVGNVANKAATVVGMDAARKIAESSTMSAQMMQRALKDEGIVMNHLENTIGKKGARKFKNEIKKDGKKISLHRFKVWLFGQKYKSYQECIQGTIHEINKLKDGDLKTAANSKIVDDTARAINPNANPTVTKAKAVTTAAKVGHSMKKMDKVIEKKKKSVHEFEEFWGLPKIPR